MTLHEHIWPKEGFARTWPIVQKTLEDHGVSSKAQIAISIETYVK
jgi:hypothetical protein